MLTKHCLQEFILDCQLRRLSPRTVKGYHNNTLNFLIYSEKHYEITEVEEIRTVHIKQYIQYLLNKKLTASYINGILKCLRAFFHFAVQEEYIYANPTDKVRMQNHLQIHFSFGTIRKQGAVIGSLFSYFLAFKPWTMVYPDYLNKLS